MTILKTAARETNSTRDLKNMPPQKPGFFAYVFLENEV